MSFGSGSILAMRISLSNNKKLLKKRSTLFNKKTSVAELREFYRKQERLQSKPLTAAQKSEILSQVKQRNIENNRKVLLGLIAAVIAMLVSVFVLATVLFQGAEAVHEKKTKSEPKSGKMYSNHLEAGKKALAGGKPFFAIGSFEAAIEQKPGDESAIKLLAQSLLLLCENKEKSCDYSKKAVDSLHNRYGFVKPFKRGTVGGGSDRK